jgi:SAM-dependent methyltransferase
VKVFDLYAAYYDLLYRDKDYAAETTYVRRLLDAADVSDGSILELGCGTGGHAVELAQDGFTVTGIDFSRTMIEGARRRIGGLSPDVAKRVDFQFGDVRNYRGSTTHRAVVSLFHVMSYQTGNDDQDQAFTTARAHLDRGGVFLFDFWYGPAVLSDRPKHAVKEVSDDRIRVRRETTPVLHENQNCVEVRFDVQITSSIDERCQRMSEAHMMRYLFLPEIEERLSRCGFRLLSSSKWMSNERLSDRTWYGCVVAVAK